MLVLSHYSKAELEGLLELGSKELREAENTVVRQSQTVLIAKTNLDRSEQTVRATKQVLEQYRQELYNRK